MTDIPEWALLEAVGLKVEAKYRISGNLSSQSGMPWEGTNGELEIITRSPAIKAKAKELAARGRNDKTLYYTLLAARNYPDVWGRLLAAGSGSSSGYTEGWNAAIDAVQGLRKP